MVQAGETLSSIANQYGVTVEALMDANSLTDANLVVQGQRLFVSVLVTDTPSPTPSPEPTTEDLGIITPTSTLVTPTPIPPPLPDLVVGLPVDLLILIDDATIANVQAIYARGQEMGNDPHAFSKIGDSTIENPHFLTRFDDGPYTLGDFAALQPMIDYYHGSFSRQGVAVKRGMNSWVVTDPMWADPEQCEPNEGPMACEIRLHRPSVAFIRLGTNDVGSEGFRDNLHQIIQYCIDHGVIPIIGTKADRYRDPYNQVNAILIAVAAEMHVPLFDFDRASQILPDHGMTVDGTHLTTFFTQDYRQGYALWTGYGLHNMLALMTLDRVWQAVTGATVLTSDRVPTAPAPTATDTATPVADTVVTETPNAPPPRGLPSRIPRPRTPPSRPRRAANHTPRRLKHAKGDWGASAPPVGERRAGAVGGGLYRCHGRRRGRSGRDRGQLPGGQGRQQPAGAGPPAVRVHGRGAGTRGQLVREHRGAPG